MPFRAACAIAICTQSGNRSSAQVEFRNVRDSAGTLLEGKKYVYDALGNIIEIRQSTSPFSPLVKYTYDSQNQLTSEVYYDGSGDTSGNITATYTYTYDTAGNILNEGHGGIVTKAYSYAYRDTDTGNDAWGDLLVAVDGHTISYDDSGNPLNWYNGKKTFSGLRWEHGRQLTSITTGGKTTTYAYDADGIRTEKVINGVTHHYVTRGGKLMRESFLSGSTEIIMDFSYDESGRPFAVSYSKDGGASFTTYYYATNLQGDVVMIFGRAAIKDANGNVTGYTVKSYGYYTYDAWGNVTAYSSTGGTPATTSLICRNPLRYRGYIYDTETGFYYLQSRYYDPANHRFINADVYTSTDSTNAISCNMFAYCGNNPVSYIDPNGDFFCALIGAIGGAIGGAINAAISGDNIWAGAVNGAACGAIAGATVDVGIATGGIGGVVIAAVGGAAASFSESLLNDVANGRDLDLASAGISAGIGAISNMLSFGLVDKSMLKSGGNLLKTAFSNGTKQLMANTTRTVAGNIVLKTTKGILKNVAKNILSSTAETVMISVTSGLVGKPIKELIAQ